MISIIVPIYNTETYLQRCLESLLCQTEQDLQIILVDDGSTDGSYTIAHSFAARDTRILLLQQPHAGQSAARNLALQHAQGEFLAFVDADDTLEPEWCEKHLHHRRWRLCAEWLQTHIQQRGDKTTNPRISLPIHLALHAALQTEKNGRALFSGRNDLRRCHLVR